MLCKRKLADLADRNGLILEEASIVPISSGLDFMVAFASDTDGAKWVLRIPRRADAVERARKELRILDLVGRHLPVQVPRWEVFSEEFIACRQMDGHPACMTDLEAKFHVWRIDEKNVPKSLEQTLAQALAVLHTINPKEAVAAGWRVLDAAQLRQDMNERMLRVRTKFGVNSVLWERWQRWLANGSLWPGHTALVHGDLHAGHILIDDVPKVTGIIDWTEAMVGDPAIDFAAHWITFGDEALKRLIAAYQRWGGRTWPGMFEHVVELCAASAVTLAEFAMSSGVDEYHQMARQSLGVAT